MNLYVKLARQAINEFITNNNTTNVPNDLPKEMLVKRAGVFVSIHKTTRNVETQNNTEGELRGCIGTILPTKTNIAQEIIDNAISACSRDYRFSPITKDELDNLEISVDVLSEPELITNNSITSNSFLISKLDAKKYGVIVKSRNGSQIGLLLPDLEEVDSPEIQVAIARQKAGIDPSESVYLYRFEVTRYKE